MKSSELVRVLKMVLPQAADIQYVNHPEQRTLKARIVFEFDFGPSELIESHPAKAINQIMKVLETKLRPVADNEVLELRERQRISNELRLQAFASITDGDRVAASVFFQCASWIDEGAPSLDWMKKELNRWPRPSAT